MYVSSLLLLLVARGLARSCPAPCSCWNKVSDCSDKELVAPPFGLPLHTTNLSLAHNKVLALPPGYFSCYTDLMVLDLRNNSLTELPAGLFRPLVKLTHLDLSYNNLSRLTRELLRPARNLVHLLLSHNPGLSVIAPRALSGLPRLQHLDLSFDGLTGVSQDLLDGLPATVSVRLAGNPWLCGCSMEPLLKWVARNLHQCNSDSREVECAGPPEVKGIPLFTLTEESFKACHFSLTLDDYLFIAFVGFIVSIASVATNFLLGITANCCHRWNKANEEEEM
ncbi:leucine-rich repeat-containing protein 55-like isoform X1 [Chiloscyllium plagiosum]|uniref:leucine-rich repeat-containing protein 55-like isoform X1 n=1 Tax=Chiloscyllium plagiosum TaxID=36176 RepID=UPI001CB81699|nr:leucine-rich repeat-containing protein 55-like isoform X1 [Chiloscyllium plagiosum]XP_043539425.1 leucine-rich repeat-containing protein 55-like isoform X1 [Chiloscyllium plagiosum]